MQEIFNIHRVVSPRHSSNAFAYLGFCHLQPLCASMAAFRLVAQILRQEEENGCLQEILARIVGEETCLVTGEEKCFLEKVE